MFYIDGLFQDTIQKVSYNEPYRIFPTILNTSLFICCFFCVNNIVGSEPNDPNAVSFNFVIDLVGEHRVEIPLFRTEEGRYLATSMDVHSLRMRYYLTLIIIFLALGDPLIKGLTEVANIRPSDPVTFLANYLHGFSKLNNMVSSTNII